MLCVSLSVFQHCSRYGRSVWWTRDEQPRERSRSRIFSDLDYMSHSLSVNVWSWRVSTFDFETDWVWDSRTQATLA